MKNPYSPENLKLFQSAFLNSPINFRRAYAFVMFAMILGIVFLIRYPWIVGIAMITFMVMSLWMIRYIPRAAPRDAIVIKR